MKTTEHNIRNLYYEIAFFGILFTIASTFLPVYALRLGATDDQIGYLSALPALITALCLVPAALFVETRRRLLPIVLRASFLFRSQYALIAFVPFLPPAMQVAALLIIVSLGAIPTAVSNLAFNTMFPMVVPKEGWARVVSRRSAITSLTQVVTALAAGKFLELLPLPVNYQALFLGGFALSLVSVACLAQLKVPDVPSVLPTTWQPRQLLAQARRFGATVRSTRSFTGFTAVSLLTHWAVWLPMPLFAIFWVRDLGASEAWIGLLTTVGAALSMLVYPVWGRAAERYGHRAVLIAGVLGIVPYPILTAVSPNAEFLMAPAVIGGLLGPAFNMGMFNVLLEVAPAHHRAMYIASYTSGVNLVAFLAPIVATSIILPVAGIHATIILGTVLRLISAVAVIVWSRRQTAEPTPG